METEDVKKWLEIVHQEIPDDTAELADAIARLRDIALMADEGDSSCYTLYTGSI